ncbi:MAG: hypothetical protein IJR14_10820 [Synergistaceae bacterium]|nr:hypothetical protein [Synergistaceae bacterium]
MTTMSFIEVHEDLAGACDRACSGGAVLISRGRGPNVVMLSEDEYDELVKAKSNERYLAMLDRSIEEAKSGQLIVKTIEELESYA